MELKNKKHAQFFSIDALIALTIIILVVIIVAPTLKKSARESDIPSDLIEVLNSMKISELDGINLTELNIEDSDKKVIEQIGEFYLTNKTIAKQLAEQILFLVDDNQNIGIWYGNELLASKNITKYNAANSVTTARQVISGIGGIGGVTGMSTRAYVSSSSRVDYFYFGGYVGEGNISRLIEYSGNISSANIELVISDDFEILINGISQGTFSGSPDEFTPVVYNISTLNFTSGTNIIEFAGDNLHISGGFIKISYDSEVVYEKPEQYKFPGISGAINLYDSFYIPGNLTGLEISLHFNNSIETLLIIGNTTVLNSSTVDQTFIITNATLSSILNYDELSQKTIPLRFGMKNASYVANGTMDIDVYSVTDLSGSMDETCEGIPSWWWWCDGESNCNSCGGIYTNKIQDAKDANYLFINMILNSSENRVGLTGYATSAPDTTYHILSNNNNSLRSEITSWNAEGWTCICCGINKAVEGLLANSSSNKFRSVVVMSDGEATQTCPQQGTGNAANDAIQAACDAYNNYGIKVYTIGFGSGAGVQTLTDMADCGDGSFFATVDDLESIYEQIAEEIISAAYFEQTLEIIGNYQSKLFPNSYIEFEYDKVPDPKGLVSTVEQQFSNSTTGYFEIPENYSVVGANVISYSGPRWTSSLKINGNDVYNLSNYKEDFIKLGDPYSINIPASLISDSNTVTIGTGLSSNNISAGSINDTIIYTIAKDVISYNSVSAFAEGCIWDVQFRNKNSTIIIPENYTGSTSCSYKKGNMSCGLVDCPDSTDAIQLAIYNLFKNMDFDSDGIVDVELSGQDLQIEISTLEGIPFYHSTEVQIRQWE